MPTGIYKRLLKGKYGKCSKCDKLIYSEPNKFGKNRFCSRKCFYDYRKGWCNDEMRDALEKGRRLQKGKRKSAHMRNKLSETYKIKWRDLRYREDAMKHRTPEKLIKMRAGHKRYLEENKGNLPLRKNRLKNKVIDKILKNGN